MTADIVQILREATRQGKSAAAAKKEELKNAGPRWKVTDGQGHEYGTMLDVCGFASCHIPSQKGFNGRMKLIKKLVEERYLFKHDYGRTSFVLRLSIPDQEMSVNEAGARAASEVIKAAGFDSYMDSRID
jgi:hypothetical protein